MRGQTTQQYTFNGVNNHITSNGFAYDAAGNVTNDSIHSYAYDAEGRLKAVDSGNTAKYNYDAFGNRTMQFSTTPAVYNEYVVDLSGRAITAIQPGTSNVYTAEVFAGGRHWVTDNGSALFLGTDWLGTTRALTELNGTFAQLYPSLPWGDGLSSGGSSFDTTSQYTGKEYDPESASITFPHGSSPVQGRWLTPDPAGVSAMNLASPQSWNRYAYALNNPVSNVDPTGLYPGGECDTADPGCTGDMGGFCDASGNCSGVGGADGVGPDGIPYNWGSGYASGQYSGAGAFLPSELTYLQNIVPSLYGPGASVELTAAGFNISWYVNNLSVSNNGTFVQNVNLFQVLDPSQAGGGLFSASFISGNMPFGPGAVFSGFGPGSASANVGLQRPERAISDPSRRLATCDILAAFQSTGAALKNTGKIAAAVGFGVTSIGTAAAQPEIVAPGVAITVVGGAVYVGGAVLKGASGIALNQFCFGF